jgi:predicted RNA-binding protein
VIKVNGVDLFKHPVVKAWHEYFLTTWKSDKAVAMFLPCTSVKPYSRSATHRLAYALLKKYGLEEKVQVYSVSEPMLLVPKELEECYPFNSYDYPPAKMSEAEKEEFSELLVPFLRKVSSQHERLIAVLPRHHYKVVEKASGLAHVSVELHSYGRLAFKTISGVIAYIKVFQEESYKIMKASQGGM